jgi:GNAT superfamily N-acetyltransferase
MIRHYSERGASTRRDEAGAGAGAGEVFSIYVQPSWWGTKVGQRLLELAHEQLSQRYREAFLTVLAANPRARRFHERNGWELMRVKVEPQFG